ncbi:DUF1648 domain-containing protein [Zongyangia hominis]|uniref:DUF1648 domain-containing protein n=1 Tax=Zongyangia hominis TaxID=2763677 RepID=A0A926IAC7_9FIRM|nr:DUF1648 domain-containing protein [Zongyangia hominis]MBC8570076.1 DUF1648 domain-containing protein [Zongyangia hominis]
MKEKLTYTTGQKVMEILSLAVVVLTALWMLISWSGIPDKIPTHFGFSGEVDSWGSKSSLLVFLAIEAGVYLLLTMVNRFPKIWNMPVEVTQKNRDFVYRTTLTMLCVVKLVIVSWFAWILRVSMAQKNLSGWALPVFLLALFGPLIYYLVKCVKGAKLLDAMEESGQDRGA